jgi:hypothetical protein
LDRQEKPVRSLIRIAVMVVVSLLTLTMAAGGYASKGAFEEMGLYAVLFGGLPVLVLISLFHVLDSFLGAYARIPIALIGLVPLFLLVYFGGGDDQYARVLIPSGLAWSAAWLATSLISRAPPKGIPRQVDP